MPTLGWVVIGVIVALIVVGGIAWALSRQRRSQHLRERFGPEYDRVQARVKDQRQAESVLQQREKRVEAFALRPLADQDRTRFVSAWRQTQARFVDAPSEAIRDADRLVNEVMATRGYPMGQFEQQAADISVDHPQVVANYRAAHMIAVHDERGAASTEQLRQAMVSYRSLFDELLGAERTAPAGRER